MQIKKFEAIDMQEALRMVKNDLGSEAIILSSRKVKRGGGTFGLLGRPVVEVTAAVDYPSLSEVKRAAAALPQNMTKAVPMEAFVREDILRLKEEIQSLLQGYLSARPAEFEEIRKDIAEIREKMQGLSMNSEKTEEHLPFDESVDSNKDLFQALVTKGVDERLASRLLKMSGQSVMNDSASKSERGKTIPDVKLAAFDILQKQTRVAGPIYRAGDGKKAVIFVGPTGGGKTTTLAKIAAHYALVGKKKVVLITLDTYRIAAVEQLKIYAKIIGLPVEVVLSPNELSGIFRRHQTTDLFLIDTAGRSQKDVAHIAELATYYNMGNPTSGDTAVKISGQLILPASLRSDVLLEVVQRFSGVPIQGIIFTKLDEVNSYGSIFNTMIWAQCPLSYLTMGQRVPEDIELATPEKVAHWVMD